jgi:DNA-directed RNA polymerase subunit RPC12/RpoP
VKFCHKCGTQAIDDESVFCNKCGTKFIQNPPEKKDDVCPSCGTKILDKQSVFCNKCGSQVSAILPNQPPTDQPPPKQIKPTKTCPHCNAPIIDESRYYCKTCGAYLHESQLPETAVNKKNNENNRLSQVKGKPDSANPGIPSERSNAYKPNWILILAFGFGLLSILIPPILLIFVIASAIAVYYDAKAIRAGEQLTKESTMNTHTWSPLSWGLIVLLFWIICLPLYLIKRREIFFINHKELSFSNSDERSTPSEPVPILKSVESSRYTAIGTTTPACPYCNFQFDNMPKSKRQCPNCKKTIYNRTRPLDNKKVLLTEDQLVILEDELKIRHMLSLIRRYVNTPRQQTVYDNVKLELTTKFGKTPNDNDIFWAFLNNETRYYASCNNWGLYTSAVSQQAQLLLDEGKNKQALTFYLWVCYMDLNGPENLGGLGKLPGVRPFNPKMGFLAPGLIDQIVKINASLGLSQDDIKTLFLEHNKKIHDSLKLPISPDNAWIDIEKAIRQEK